MSKFIESDKKAKDYFKKTLNEGFSNASWKWFVEYVDGELIEDSYEEGEIGRPISQLSEKVNEVYEDFHMMVKNLNRSYGIPEDLKNWGIIEDGRFVVQDLTDDDWITASPREIEDWKNGLRTLYSANYNIYVKVIKTSTPSIKDMKITGVSEI